MRRRLFEGARDAAADAKASERGCFRNGDPESMAKALSLFVGQCPGKTNKSTEGVAVGKLLFVGLQLSTKHKMIE